MVNLSVVVLCPWFSDIYDIYMFLFFQVDKMKAKSASQNVLLSLLLLPKNHNFNENNFSGNSSNLPPAMVLEVASKPIHTGDGDQFEFVPNDAQLGTNSNIRLL